MKKQLLELADQAARYFFRPEPELSWEQIVRGTTVVHPDGRIEKIIAVGANTFRGFHRLDKSDTGPQEAFMDFFVAGKRRISIQLDKVRTATDLHELSNRLCAELISELYNVRPDQLRSYNKVRKPVDLYLEHLVRMARELKPLRPVLVPLLFLPLDSWILDHPAVFSGRDLRLLGLDRGLSYGDITAEKTYLALQQLAQQQADTITSSVGVPFHRIYYDMFWNNRLAH